MAMVDNCPKCGKYTKLTSKGMCKTCLKKEKEERDKK